MLRQASKQQKGEFAVSFQQSFKALADPTRRQVLELLREGPLTAGEIGGRFPMTAATISHHLSVLREAGLVLDERRGKYIYYELNMTVMDELLAWAASFRREEERE